MYDNRSIPRHRRTLRKMAAMSAEDAIRQVQEESRLSDEASKASKAYYEDRDKLLKPLYDNKSLDEKTRKDRIKQQTERYDKGSQKSRLSAAEKAEESARKKRENYITLAQNPHLDKAYLGMTKDEVQKLLKDKKLTGADFAKIDAKQLTMGQNLKALGHDLKNQSYTPNAMFKRGWENMGEGEGGGYLGGTRTGRHIVGGGKSLGLMFSAPDFKDAYNKSDPTGEGRSRTERVGHAVGGFTGGLLGSVGANKLSRLPGGGIGRFVGTLAAGMGGMMGGYYVGGKAGKALDKGISNARGVTAGDYKQDLLRRAGAPRKKDGTY